MLYIFKSYKCLNIVLEEDCWLQQDGKVVSVHYIRKGCGSTSEL